MKFLVVYFLATAVNCALSLSLPKAIAQLPFLKPNNPSSVDIADIPPVQPTLTINGNVTIQINDNRQTCCNQQNNKTVTHERPKLPDGYVITSESDEYITAIKFHPTGQTWNEARKTCTREGGFLAYATNKEEEDLYLKMMDEKKLDDLWIGIHDFFYEGDFATVDGKIAKEVAYYTWLPGEPNNKLGPEPCAQYTNDGNQKGLNDLACNSSFAFNCKVQLRKN